MGTQNKIAQSHKFLRALMAVIFAAGMTCIAAPAAAEGWYAGASFGNAGDRNWCNTNLGACDDTGSGKKIFAGNQINDFFAYEFGYNDLGKRSDIGISAEATGFVVSLVGMIPIGDMFSISLRVGTFYWDEDIRNTNPALSGSDDGPNLTLGIGAHIPMGKRFTARVEWERYDVNQDDINLLSAGIAYNFGK
ncbi:MAG: hypothetical protein A2809_03580 [Candidatus Muproteobacteria bacterium RIFCSPHIGHO2_01_FULL_61_200]|nr:MAG: hypothetical protein A2809_03580 [Candidatus Muproteobacteria bacterium RIFCSPHIGHO2_01_FULL_61_200]